MLGMHVMEYPLEHMPSYVLVVVGEAMNDMEIMVWVIFLWFGVGRPV